ncbi:MAG TPA: acyl-CoA dehydrogenase family protein [Oligoflexia bacterium]|nr:acyl-CoA dehydrogenase family protein [Oligoflexia bacterium]HMP47417.1 acyl-CoA dehydrogenase family protein [Oligoflexia bacterium]
MNNLISKVKECLLDQPGSVDAECFFPEKTISSLKNTGLLGLISSTDVGGMGEGIKEASVVCETIAQHCASSAMITCMHYCATAVIEQFGDTETRKNIAAGKHLSTLAFSEYGSRSHFWAPLSTAKDEGGYFSISARKSWITSAHFADSYIWSSQSVSKKSTSSIFIVPAKSDGISIISPYFGLGLRGNDSCPVQAENVKIPKHNILGKDGDGFSIMMGTVLPMFSILNSSISVGIMNSALTEAIRHCSETSYEHLGQSLADLPTIRAYLAKASIQLDTAKAIRDKAINSILENSDDAMLDVLKVKAACGESAVQVCDLAMRVCGGAAFRKEVGVERNFRDARASFIMAPTSDALYDFIGKALCGMELF